MSDPNNTDIDNKKEEVNNKENTVDTSITNRKNISDFFYSTLVSIAQLAVVIWIGSMMLYSCRAAAANAYPVCTKYYPYTTTEFDSFNSDPVGGTFNNATNISDSSKCKPIEDDADVYKDINRDTIKKGGGNSGDAIALGLSLTNAHAPAGTPPKSSTTPEQYEPEAETFRSSSQIPPNVFAPINIIKYADKTDPANPENKTFVSLLRFNLKKIFSTGEETNVFKNFCPGWPTDGYNRESINSDNSFSKYCAIFFQDVISCIFKSISFVYKVLNQYCSESVIIFVMPFFLMFIVPAIIIITILYGAWSLLSNYKLLAKNNANDPNETINTWWKLLKTVSYCFLVCFFVFLIYWLVGGPLITFMVIFGFMWTLFIPSTIVEYDDAGKLCERAYYLFKLPTLDAFTNINVNGPFSANKTKRVKARSLFMDVLKNKSQVIMAILSYHVVQNSFKYFGSYNGFVAFIICIIIYIFSKPINIYGQYLPSEDEMGAASENAINGNKTPCPIFNIDPDKLMELTKPEPFYCP